MRASRTREHILETAAAAFAERGYAATSLNELVRRSGLTKGAFYHHFDSKEELALAAFRRKQEQLVALVAPAAEGATDGLAALAALLRARARALRDEPSLRAVLRLGSELGSTAGPDSQHAAYQELALELFADLLRRGREEGAVRPDLDPRAAAEMVFAAMVGMDEVSGILSGGEDIEARTEVFVELLAHGLAAPKTSERRSR